MDQKNLNPQQPIPSQPTLPAVNQPIQEAVQHPAIWPKLIIVAVIIIVFLIAGGIGGYFYLKNTQFSNKITNSAGEFASNNTFLTSEADKNPAPEPLKTSGVKYKDKPVNKETLTVFTKEELEDLDVMQLPQGFQIQGEYKGIKFVNTPKRAFSEKQLKLLYEFIDNTPKKLLSPGPSAIITYAEGEVNEGIMSSFSVAFASGSYIFFSDKSFNQEGFLRDNNLDDVYYAFEHELTHVSQFNGTIGELDEASLSKLSEVSSNWQLIANKLPLISNFADIAGWVKTDSHNIVTYNELKDKENAETTDYGKTKILEDMAETVAGIIMARDYEFSPERKNWALQFLGENYDSFKPNKFPFSPLFQATKLIAFDEYDTEKEKAYQVKYEMFDKQTFVSDEVKSLEEIKNYFNQELSSRGWIGSFNQSEDRYKGEFTGSERDMYIELIDEVGRGIFIIVINGYKL